MQQNKNVNYNYNISAHFQKNLMRKPLMSIDAWLYYFLNNDVTRTIVFISQFSIVTGKNVIVLARYIVIAFNL